MCIRDRDQAVSDIDDSVQRLVAKAMAEAKEENEKARQSQDLSDTAEFPAQGAKEPCLLYTSRCV